MASLFGGRSNSKRKQEAPQRALSLEQSAVPYDKLPPTPTRQAHSQSARLASPPPPLPPVSPTKRAFPGDPSITPPVNLLADLRDYDTHENSSRHSDTQKRYASSAAGEPSVPMSPKSIRSVRSVPDAAERRRRELAEMQAQNALFQQQQLQAPDHAFPARRDSARSNVSSRSSATSGSQQQQADQLTPRISNGFYQAVNPASGRQSNANSNSSLSHAPSIRSIASSASTQSFGNTATSFPHRPVTPSMTSKEPRHSFVVPMSPIMPSRSSRSTIASDIAGATAFPIPRPDDETIDEQLREILPELMKAEKSREILDWSIDRKWQLVQAHKAQQQATAMAVVTPATPMKMTRDESRQVAANARETPESYIGHFMKGDMDKARLMSLNVALRSYEIA